ncbi:hypothetical protein FN846DRAFT_981523 [Sphaerosporella brunnea]|uniref:Uncharacterized protein n=1 Tax=Sphaerosporella brunnea TaxID=1250544 RepID=A0A5J5ECP9_9PEZI|nr:hypothetical protein FN846DRAFT_981523 [Sphaerosporella brunnea]
MLLRKDHSLLQCSTITSLTVVGAPWGVTRISAPITPATTQPQTLCLGARPVCSTGKSFSVSSKLTEIGSNTKAGNSTPSMTFDGDAHEKSVAPPPQQCIPSMIDCRVQSRYAFVCEVRNGGFAPELSLYCSRRLGPTSGSFDCKRWLHCLALSTRQKAGPKSTMYTSIVRYCPSGNGPLGKSDKSPNSGSVNSPSCDKTSWDTGDKGSWICTATVACLVRCDQ